MGVVGEGGERGGEGLGLNDVVKVEDDGDLVRAGWNAVN